MESLLPFCGKPTSFHFTKNGGQQELIFLSSGTLYCDRVFNSSGSKIAEDMCSIQADDRKDSKSWPWKKLYNDDAKRQLNRYVHVCTCICTYCEGLYILWLHTFTQYTQGYSMHEQN